MPAAQRPTTLNSMTHYALTEEQADIMAVGVEGEGQETEGEEGAMEEALVKALQSTPSNPADTRVASAIGSGLLVPELLPSRVEQERLQREGSEEEQEQMRRDEEERQQQGQEQYQQEQR
jgi:hypothetical protein